jgi:hypothetical protein
MHTAPAWWRRMLPDGGGKCIEYNICRSHDLKCFYLKLTAFCWVGVTEKLSILPSVCCCYKTQANGTYCKKSWTLQIVSREVQLVHWHATVCRHCSYARIFPFVIYLWQRSQFKPVNACVQGFMSQNVMLQYNHSVTQGAASWWPRGHWPFFYSAKNCFQQRYAVSLRVDSGISRYGVIGCITAAVFRKQEIHT